MDAITRARLSEHAAREQGGLPASWLFAACAAWLIVGLLFALWNVFVGAAVALIGVAVTVAGFIFIAGRTEIEYEEIPIHRSDRRAPPPSGFVALGDTQGSGRSASFQRPVPKPAPEVKPEVPRPENSFEAFCALNPPELVQAQRMYLNNLREKTETRIVILEPVLRARLHKNRKEELEGFLQAQQILAALDERVADLDDALNREEWGQNDVRRFWELCYGKLELKSDAMSTLHTEELAEEISAPAENISATNCEAKLEEIFKLLKRRQTFFRALNEIFAR